MNEPMPVFEHSTSPLTTSNDGRLSVHREHAYDDGRWAWSVIDTHTGAMLAFTRERVVADAYIAGYDRASETL